MEPLRQITTYPSRAAIAALEGYELKHQNENRRRGDNRASRSSSEYAIEAIARHGLLLGGGKGVWHALRCRFQREPVRREG